MPLSVLGPFLIIFTWILVSVAIAGKLYEVWRRKRMTERLKTVVETPLEGGSKLLKDPSLGDRPLERLLERLQVMSKLEAYLRQSGLDWTVGKLLLRVGLAAVVGVAVGLILPAGY